MKASWIAFCFRVKTLPYGDMTSFVDMRPVDFSAGALSIDCVLLLLSTPGTTGFIVDQDTRSDVSTSCDP